MKRKLWHLVGLFAAVVLTASMFGGCNSSDDEPVNKQTTTEETRVEETSTEIIITDQIGRTVTLEAEPETIVSLAPSNTEVLYSLNLGDRIVGVSDYCNYPEEAMDKPKIGGYSTTDVERIVAAEPDVIFGTNMHVTEILPALEALGQTVIILDPRNLDDVLESFRIVGKATGKNNRAEKVIAAMSERIKAITDKTGTLSEEQKLRTFYVMWHDPLMTVGGTTRISEMIELSGGINIYKDSEDGYPTIDLESLVEANPQVIIAGSGMGEGADAPYQFALTEARLENSDARKNNMVYEINTDLTGRPTERMIDGLEQMAKMIHPELFDTP
ncbi:MAG: cobalamin-binding protein [Dehalococcoidales bacterium]|nr:cobalamin-binding protein [Dehalococcoidales bacterium]